MGGRGVDDARRLGAHRLDRLGGLPRRFIRQAEDDEIDLAKRLSLAAGSLRCSGGRLRSDARQSRELVADLQAGGSGFAVDENAGGHDGLASEMATRSRPLRARGEKVSVGGGMRRSWRGNCAFAARRRARARVRSLGLRRSPPATQPLLHRLAHQELLHFAGDRHREFVDELDIARDLVFGDLALAEGAHLLGA